MACMEHSCIRCDWYAMDNETHKTCPKCGAPVRSFFDEQTDHDRDAYEARHDVGDYYDEEEKENADNHD